MRLRARVLSLVALSLTAALLAALLLVEKAASSQARVQLEGQLQSRLRTWEKLRNLYLESLQAEATALAAEPGLARVLRSGDRATLEDYLQYRQGAAPSPQWIQVYDAEGLLLGQSPPTSETTGPSPLLESCTESPQAAFDVRGDKPFLAAAAPLLRQGRRLEARVWLGLPLDEPFMQKLQLDLGGVVRLVGPGPSTAQGDYSLRSPLEGAAVHRWGWLEFVGDLNSLRLFISQLRWQLAGLGVGVVVCCTLLSLPWIGKTARPVEEMELTRAQLAGVVSASLDGLLALDSEGRVLLASPSASAVLGVKMEELPGRFLHDLLPEQPLSQLIAQPPGDGPLVQTCSWERPEGRLELIRTFLNEGSLITSA